MHVPVGWKEVLAEETAQPYFAELARFVNQERAAAVVFPPPEDVFAALEHTPYDRVRVVILGQDPYHDDEQAQGLCFSAPPGVRPPPSLVNIFKELSDDVGCPPPRDGCLIPWAQQGVLLLNTVLTVRAHEPQSHRRRGWEQFTDAVIRLVNNKPDRVVFVLWGRPAQAKLPLIDRNRHAVIQSAHPSPLSARRGFFGSKPFSAANAALREAGQEEIDWDLRPFVARRREA